MMAVLCKGYAVRREGRSGRALGRGWRMERWSWKAPRRVAPRPPGAMGKRRYESTLFRTCSESWHFPQLYLGTLLR